MAHLFACKARFALGWLPVVCRSQLAYTHGQIAGLGVHWSLRGPACQAPAGILTARSGLASTPARQRVLFPSEQMTPPTSVASSSSPYRCMPLVRIMLYFAGNELYTSLPVCSHSMQD